MLAFSTILGLLQLFAAAHGSMRQRSVKWNFSARDEKMPDLTGITGRIDRAFKNFMETFPFFATAVLIVNFIKTSNQASALGAQLYFFARVIYVPIYVVGTPVIRSIAWFTATIGIFMILSTLF